MESPGQPSLVAEVLEEYGDVTRRALQTYLPEREPRRFLYDLVADYPGRGGKMMRPSICIATTRAFGGRLEDALNCAVSLELFHNALLVHDDIEDGSESRRGRPTMHELCGLPLAVNVGDMLTLLSLRPLFDNQSHLGSRRTFRIVREAELAARETAEGQAMELGWRMEGIVNVTESDYLEMVLKKTCWLAIIYPVRLGALIGAPRSINLDRFIHFGFFLGAAFQIQDDLLNLFESEHSRYGKERNGDIWEGKRTLMLIHLLDACSPTEREEIERCLRLERRDKPVDTVQKIRRLMDEYGSIDYARRYAHALAGAAQAEFETAFHGLPDSRDKAFLAALPRWVLARD